MSANETIDQSIADREIVITRRFNAPPELLFEAHSKAEHLKRWFGPVGWPLTMCEVDFRVGGRYRFAMTGPDGEQNTPFGGEYLEIVPNEKIVYDDQFELPDAERFVVTVTFEEENGQTLLTMRFRFDTKRARDEYAGLGFEEGVNSGLDQLADVVATMRRA